MLKLHLSIIRQIYTRQILKPLQLPFNALLYLFFFVTALAELGYTYTRFFAYKIAFVDDKY